MRPRCPDQRHFQLTSEHSSQSSKKIVELTTPSSRGIRSAMDGLQEFIIDQRRFQLTSEHSSVEQEECRVNNSKFPRNEISYGWIAGI
ncbi:hypothetical protein CEXT_195561 [Caerostris extrusa]|uniref:Uncharacterized protein n=1 Tax=Caerostris extrusa TaxID=172846 RepID=A0AAV4R9C9_CAEEX|nr:hypothetical protein CEXT_195561 [Caerostris extrusa]